MTVLLNNVPAASIEEIKGIYSIVRWVGDLRHTQDREGFRYINENFLDYTHAISHRSKSLEFVFKFYL